MTVRVFANAILVLSVFMLAGFFIREYIKPLQKLFLPSSLIGGVLILILGQQGFGFIEVPAAFKGMPTVLIDFVMASLVFGVDFNREKLKEYLDYVCVPMPCYGMQMCIGTGLGYVLSKIWPGLPIGWGVMGVFSFHGGHGTAAAAGAAFQKLGINGNMEVGMILSTIGLVVAMIIGMIIVNYGVRKGWATYVKEPTKQPAYFYGGTLPEDKRKETGHMVTTGISINHLALQACWLFASLFLGQKIFALGTLVIPSLSHLPSVLHGVVGGAVMWQLIKTLKLQGYVDVKTVKMISGFLLELVVFTAMATLNVKFISTYIAPILIYTIALVVLTIPLDLWCAKRFCKDEWFEKAVMSFGAATGNTSTGLALVRAVDPDSQSSAGDTHGVYATLMGWKDIFVGLTPMWLLSGVGMTMGVGAAICIGFFLCGMFFFDTKKRVRQ
jgi:Na+/glutamate symporter